MKKAWPVWAGGLVVIVVIGLLGYGWYQSYGPGLRLRDDRAISLVTAGNKLSADAGKTIDIAGQLPAKWQTLVFNEVAETGIIQQDLGAQRGYSIDKRRDPAAIAVAKDLVETNTALIKKGKELKTNLADLNKAKAGALSDTIRTRVSAAISANRATARRVTTCQKNVTELTHDNDVWGFFALSLQADAQLLVQLEASRAALAGGDFEVARTQALAAKESVNVSATWLTQGNQELTNIGVYSQDGSALLAFISLSKDAAEMLDQASSAGLRQEADSILRLSQTADGQLNMVRKAATNQVIGQGYAVWFDALARRRLSS